MNKTWRLLAEGGIGRVWLVGYCGAVARRLTWNWVESWNTCCVWAAGSFPLSGAGAEHHSSEIFCSLKSWVMFFCLWDGGRLSIAFIIDTCFTTIENVTRCTASSVSFCVTAGNSFAAFQSGLVASPDSGKLWKLGIFETSKPATQRSKRCHLCGIWQFGFKAFVYRCVFSLSVGKMRPDFFFTVLCILKQLGSAGCSFSPSPNISPIWNHP